MLVAPDDIAVANATARSSGAVGEGALVPSFVAKIAGRTDRILDFGAGPQALHTVRLRSKGFLVTAYDFGENVTPGLHDRGALSRQYDVVFASNVLNVANSAQHLSATLDQLAAVVAPTGMLVANLPSEPRKGAWTRSGRDEARLMALLRERFAKVRKLPRLWVCTAPHRGPDPA